MMKFEFDLVVQSPAELEALEKLCFATYPEDGGFLGMLGECKSPEDYKILKESGIPVDTVFVEYKDKDLFKDFSGWKSAETGWAMDSEDNDMDQLLEFLMKQAG